MSSLVLLLVAVDRSPAKGPKRGLRGRQHVLEECPRLCPQTSQPPDQRDEATSRPVSGSWSSGAERAPRPSLDGWESKHQKKGLAQDHAAIWARPGPRLRTPSAKSTAPPSKRDLSQVPGEPTPLAPQPPEGTSRAGKQTGPARSARSVSSSGPPARPCLGRRGSPRGTAHSSAGAGSSSVTWLSCGTRQAGPPPPRRPPSLSLRIGLLAEGSSSCHLPPEGHHHTLCAVTPRPKD